MNDAMIVDAPARDATFAANRATGRIALSVVATSGQSRRARVHEAGSLRVRFPNAADAAQLEAVMVNTAGGMAGGDRFNVEIDVGAGARLSLTSAAAEKVYRSLGADTWVSVKLAASPGATLTWLPQETILFDQARLHRTIDLDLAGNANVLLAEAIVFGRAAMGEAVACGHLFDRWRVRVGGELVFAETTRLDGEIARRLSETAIAADGAAIASVLKFPGDEDSAAAIRAMQQSFVGDVGVSAWNGLALARLVAPDGAALRHDLIAVLTTWSGRTLPRLWLN
jgi:urease accessory protein